MRDGGGWTLFLVIALGILGLIAWAQFKSGERQRAQLSKLNKDNSDLKNEIIGLNREHTKKLEGKDEISKRDKFAIVGSYTRKLVTA